MWRSSTRLERTSRESWPSAARSGCFLIFGVLLALTAAGSISGARAVSASAPQGSSSTSSVRSEIEQAQKALDAGDYSRAKAELERALQADPGSAEAHLMLGLVEFRQGSTSEAIEHFQRGLKLNPASFSGHYNLAMAYLHDHDLKAGRSELERAVSLNPRDANAAYNLGVVLLELGRAEEALEHLRRARALGSERPDVAFNIIRAELQANRWEEARHEADRVAEIFGADADWQAAVGREFAEQGLAREGIAHLKEAYRLRPNSDEIRRLLARANLDAGAAPEALDLISKPRGAEDHYLRASALYLLHRIPEANAESRLALEADRHQPRYLLLQARILQLEDDNDSALELLREAAQLASDWPGAYYSAGVSYYFERRYEEARRSLDRALELNPKSARTWFLYSATLVNEGKNRQAEEYLSRALALEPGNARFYYHLGALLMRDNRPEEARKAFETSARLRPDYALPHYQLGKLLARSNQLTAAVHELEFAIQNQPDLAQAYYQLGRVYAALGEREKSQGALAAFTKMKKQEQDETQEFTEEVKKELQLPAGGLTR